MTPPLAPLPLGRGLLLTDFGALAPFLLTPGVLPAAHLLQALRVLTLPLVSAAGLVDESVALAQASTQRAAGACWRKRAAAR